MITKDGDVYRLDCYPHGRSGKRIVKTFKTKKQALQYQKDLLLGNVETTKADNRTLTDYIHIWYELHGISLKSGIDTRNRLLNLAKAIHDPPLRTLSIVDLVNYRKQRLDQGITASTLNRELSTLKALYSELRYMGVIRYEIPLLLIRKLKQHQRELTYLTKSQLARLLKQVTMTRNESLPYVVKIALATGARWSECEALTIDNLHNNGFYFTDTKNGSSRFVPVSPSLYQHIQQRLQQAPFKSCYSAFRSAYNRTRIQSKGQCAHILRHTFASYFVMSGGNLIALKQILGHSSLTTTMRYAHLAPNYLSQAVQFNPLEH